MMIWRIRYVKWLIRAEDAPAPPALVVAAELAVELVMHLAVKDLKDVLKKRGQATLGKKRELHRIA
jgi:hypothetical protein